jgi:hypothetical protein
MLIRYFTEALMELAQTLLLLAVNLECAQAVRAISADLFFFTKLHKKDLL